MDIKASIEDTRKGFKESFASGDFYNRQTQDAEADIFLFQSPRKTRIVK